MGQHPEGIPMTVELAKQMDKTRSLPRYFAQSNPTLKDTISIPSKGYAIIRFKVRYCTFFGVISRFCYLNKRGYP